MQDQRTSGERTNTDRALRALKGLSAGRYTRDAGFDQAALSSAIYARDPQRIPDDQNAFHQVVKDALCDLHHLCDRVGVEFDAALHGAIQAYEAETVEDEAGGWPLYLEPVE